MLDGLGVVYYIHKEKEEAGKYDLQEDDPDELQEWEPTYSYGNYVEGI